MDASLQQESSAASVEKGFMSADSQKKNSKTEKSALYYTLLIYYLLMISLLLDFLPTIAVVQLVFICIVQKFRELSTL